MTSKLYIPLLFLAFYFSKTSAQSIMPSNISFAANSLSNTNYSLDFTLGQIISNTLNSSQNCLTQGFLQPDYNVVSVTNFKKNDNIVLFPNPTTNLVTISTNANTELKQVSIYNIDGKLMYTGNESTVNLQEYPSGNYLFIVNTTNSQVIAKIIKN